MPAPNLKAEAAAGLTQEELEYIDAIVKNTVRFNRYSHHVPQPRYADTVDASTRRNSKEGSAGKSEPSNSDDLFEGGSALLGSKEVKRE